MVEESANTKISIGELSRLTGISTFQLRVWEQRYGSPQSIRLPSGHRRYSRQEVPRLRAVSQALQAGHRPRHVVPATLEELEQLLNVYPLVSSKRGAEGASPNDPAVKVLLENWIDAVHRYSDQSLTFGFYEEWGKRGPLNFVIDCAAPFLRLVGDGWETGELNVAHEHFASERLGDFLGNMWRRLQERNDGPVCVLANLPGETHRLGLQMCAVILALANRRIIFLGPNTPCESIFSAVTESDANLLAVSLSEVYPRKDAEKRLQMLRRSLDPEVTFVLGGKGACHAIEGVTVFSSLLNFYDWLQLDNREAVRQGGEDK